MTSLRGAGIRALSVLAAGALIAGCGVPTQTDVQVEGPLPGAGPGDDLDPVSPPGPDDANSADQLIDYFLLAAATDPDNAEDHLRGFIHSDEAEAWQPDPQVMVVRVLDQFSTPGERVRVRLDVRVVGSLSRGIVEPRDDTRSFELEVTAEPTGIAGDDLGDQGTGPRFRIVNPPDMIMLSDQALTTLNLGYLTPSPIYFWDSDGQVLVPDLRWLPTALGPARRAQAKLEWLLDGPAPWLESLASLPGEVDLEGNVVLPSREDRLDVTLTPAAGDMDAPRLDAQLWWTLHEEVQAGRTVWLTIDGYQRQVESAPTANPSAGLAPPASFVVLDGAVMAYEQADGIGLPPPAVTFDGAAEAGAVSADGHAALVHLDEAGMRRLTLATTAGLFDVGRPAGQMSRPAWLRHPGGVGLIAVDGALHRFSVAEPALQELNVPGVTDPVTAVAVAPDGRRVALVAGGDLYLTSLTRRDDGSVVVGQPRRLATTATDLAGATFLQENWLAVIGQDAGRTLLYELTVDGGFERELSGALGAPQTVTNVVGYPGDPLSSSATVRRGEVMYEADGQAYRYRYLREPDPIRVEDLAAEVPEELAGAEPRAPFYSE